MLRVIRRLVIFVITACLYLPVASAADPLGVDARVDHARQELQRILNDAFAKGDLLEQKWANDMLMLIDRLDKSLTGQQKELWRNADVQRDAFFKNLETSIDQVNRGADVQTIRLQDTVLLFDDTMRAVTRTLNDPFVIRASPSYIVPAPRDITFTISGSYLSNGNGSLRLDGRDARLIGNQPTEVKFVLPSNLLPQNSKAIVPVSLDLILVTKGWFFNGTQAYKIASFVLPPQVGNVSIVAHRTYSDTERETRKPRCPTGWTRGFRWSGVR